MTKKKNTKFIFVVGGVMSGVGKGVTTASIGQILSHQGFSVSAIKIDPYINVDAGNMDPVEHGEAFVTEDGDQTDQDLGNYERFLNKNIYSSNYMTTGRVYQSVINRERSGGYHGKCVQVVPHIPQEVRDRIHRAVEKSQAEIMVIEIGGTVGEYENLLFLEAARFMKLEQPDDVLFVIVSYLPMPSKVGEVKTKPTQHAVRTLNAAGIQPNFVVARSENDIDEVRRNKIALHCNISRDDVIAAPDADSIYEIPLNFEKDNLGQKILKKLKLKAKPTANSLKQAQDWKKMLNNLESASEEVQIAIITDFSLRDSYVSVLEALKHAGASRKLKVKIKWVEALELEKSGTQVLKNVDGLIIPQGWGEQGVIGKIKAIKYCREKKVPFLGLPYGLQLAVLEIGTHVLKLEDASSEEFSLCSTNLMIKKSVEDMRLGSRDCQIKPQSLMAQIYKSKRISERHRHAYEVNSKYRELLEKTGFIVSATSSDGKIIEAMELKNHPFFIGVQFQPEYISRPLDPHPLFLEFLKAAKDKRGK